MHDQSESMMPIELSVVIPCLNEAKTLGICIEKALRSFQELEIEGEVVVADNGSTDGSIAIAQEKGARVVHVSTRGYGAALAEGIQFARGKYVIMGDADDTYDFSRLEPFVRELRNGYELVQGNRFKGGIESGAMPFSHRYFGNPMLSALGRILFRCKAVGDFYCGLRGFNKKAIEKLDIQSTGMEFALEMIVKAGMHHLKLCEVPTTLSLDAKGRVPHLRTFRDGWRSLRFFLTMSPHWVFTYPGFASLLVGLPLFVLLFSGPLKIGEVVLDFHTLLYASAAIIIGYQGVLMGFTGKLVAAETGLHPNITRLSFLRRRSVMENMLIAAFVLFALGFLLMGLSIYQWAFLGFGELTKGVVIRVVIGSVLSLILGSQTFLAAFFFGTINMLVERTRFLKEKAGKVRGKN
jgi:glycosyltransferase involved in cell wall biosynthesis